MFVEYVGDIKRFVRRPLHNVFVFVVVRQLRRKTFYFVIIDFVHYYLIKYKRFFNINF